MVVVMSAVQLSLPVADVNARRLGRGFSRAGPPTLAIRCGACKGVESIHSHVMGRVYGSGPGMSAQWAEGWTRQRGSSKVQDWRHTSAVALQALFATPAGHGRERTGMAQNKMQGRKYK